VPPLILLPLVENAIKHGIAPHARAGTVTVTAAPINGLVALRVTDTGDGTDLSAIEHGGMGLDLTRRRLDALYPSSHVLAFYMERGRFVAELRIPATLM
jgi:two-component system, LytTR family, sensor kinase